MSQLIIFAGHNADYSYTCEKCGKGFFRPKLFKEHKCFNEDGKPIAKRAFKPRMDRRKAGRPRKKMITITDSKSNPFLSVPVDSPTIKTRPHRSARVSAKKAAAAAAAAAEAAAATSEDNSASSELEPPTQTPSETKGELSTVAIETADVVRDPAMVVTALKENIVEVSIPEAEVMDSTTGKNKKVKKPKQECYVKTPPASIMEHYVTVHLTNAGDANGNSVQAHLIPAGTSQAEIHLPVASAPAQIQISPSSNSAFQPITILETQPVTLTVSQQEQLQSLNVSSSDVIDIPVDIVTVSDEQAIVCSGAADGQTYVTCDEQIGEFSTADGDAVLHHADNLMNAAVEILPSNQVHEISLANVQ